MYIKHTLYGSRWSLWLFAVFFLLYFCLSMTPQIPHVQRIAVLFDSRHPSFMFSMRYPAPPTYPTNYAPLSPPIFVAWLFRLLSVVMRLYMFCSYSCVPFLCLVYSLCLLSPYHSVLLSLTNPPSPNIKAAFPPYLFTTDTLSRCCIVHFPVFDPDLPCTQSDLFTFTDELTGDIFLWSHKTCELIIESVSGPFSSSGISTGTLWCFYIMLI